MRWAHPGLYSAFSGACQDTGGAFPPLPFGRVARMVSRRRRSFCYLIGFFPIQPLLLAGMNDLLLPQKDVDGRSLECDLDRFPLGQPQALNALRCQDGNE